MISSLWGTPGPSNSCTERVSRSWQVFCSDDSHAAAGSMWNGWWNKPRERSWVFIWMIRTFPKWVKMYIHVHVLTIAQVAQNCQVIMLMAPLKRKESVPLQMTERLPYVHYWWCYAVCIFKVCDIGSVTDKFSNTHINRHPAFVNDSTLDFIYECTCKKDSTAFVIHIHNECEEYSELRKLALLHISRYYCVWERF